MFNLNQLVALTTLQASLNAKIDPEWVAKEYPYYRAIAVEAGEAMDHYGWKWWKKQEPNIPQVKLELVDILHFMLSEALLDAEGDVQETVASIDDLTDGEAGHVMFDDVPYELEQMDVLDKLDLMCGLAGSGRISFALFYSLAESLDFPIDEIFKTYIGKNVLNNFRQDHGDKQGTYVKTWKGQEDNVHLAAILNELDLSDPGVAETLYARLQALYQEVLSEQAV